MLQTLARESEWGLKDTVSLNYWQIKIDTISVSAFLNARSCHPHVNATHGETSSGRAQLNRT